MGEGSYRKRWRAAWPFAALCLLTASRWIIEGALPATASTLWSRAAGCAMAAGFAGALSLLRPRSARHARASGVPGWIAVLAAGLVVSGALVGESVSATHINANDSTLAMALTPVVVAVALSAVGGGESGELTGRLWPGLAGIAGLLLLLPEPSFPGWRFCVAVLAMPLLTGAAAVLAVRSRHEGDDLPQHGRAFTTASALLVAAAMFAALALWRWKEQMPSGISLSAAGLDGLTALLALVALYRLGPVRWSAQFLLIPLIALLEGVVFLHPFLDLRSWLALALMAASAVYQIFAVPGASAAMAGLGEESRVPPA